jgi:UDP-N-acetylglucosamine transferase subunit ALG13
MTFVTVGTHEQGFDRLLEEVDRLAKRDALPCPIFCQTGYSRYRPSVDSSPMLPYEAMQERILGAHVIISHGGPGSVMPALAAGRPTVLVPRQRHFGEHVDDHQVLFCRRIGETRGIPVVEDIADLEAAVAKAIASPPRRPSADGSPAGLTAFKQQFDALMARRRGR